MRRLEVVGLTGVPDVQAGDDLGELLAGPLRAAGAGEGDVVAVTSKVVAKAEGQVRYGTDRAAAVAAETVAEVAAWTGASGERTVVARTRHGLVLAAAGVDASNTEPGSIVLLPEDPDTSASRLRAALCDALGLRRLGVVITDSLGRPWREGIVDVAIGCAGLMPLDDLRGTTDAYGTLLEVTVVAVADEVAAASELVRGKADRVAAALVRGLDRYVTADDGPGAQALIRPTAMDRFRLGAREAVRAAVRAYASGVPAVLPTSDARDEAVAAVRAAVPDVEIRIDGERVEVHGPDPDRVLVARTLLAVALLGEGLPPP